MSKRRSQKMQAYKTGRRARPDEAESSLPLSEDGPINASVLDDDDDCADSEPARGPGGSDAQSRYMHELATRGHALLTPAQEISMARLLEEHLFLAADNIRKDLVAAQGVLDDRNASPDERDRARRKIQNLNPGGLKGKSLRENLFKMMRGADSEDLFESYAEPSGKALKNAFCEANLRLVISLAKKYNNGAMPLEELIQEGNIGLMHAILRFDHRRGFRFSTYGTWWIRHAIGRAIADKARVVRVPVHMLEFYTRVKKTTGEMTSKRGRPPTEEELIDALSRQPKRGGGEPEERGGKTALLEKVRKLNAYMRNPVSLDKQIYGEDGEGTETLHEMLPADEDDGKPWETLIPGERDSMLHAALESMKPVVRDILKMRFGIGHEEERTLREIGDRYGLSRERIRQLEKVGLNRLREKLGPKLNAA